MKNNIFGGDESGYPVYDPRQNETLPGRILSHPGMSAANQAMNNIAGMNMGRAPTVSPVQAYQQAVIAQATAGQQRKINDLTIQQKEQNLDAFYDYKQAKAQGIIPPEMTYSEFMQIGGSRLNSTAPIKNLAEWVRLNPQGEGESDADYAARKATAFEGFARAPSIVPIGGGGQVTYQPISQSVGGLVDPTQASFNQGEQKRMESAGSSLGAREDAMEATLGEADKVLQMREWTADLLDGIRSGSYTKTGPLEGRLSKFMDREAAQLQFLSTLNVLEKMKDATLVPVSDADIAMLREGFAQVLNDPQANAAVLEMALPLLDKAIEQMDSAMDYMDANDGTMRGFGRHRYRQLRAPKKEVDLEGL